MVRQASQPGTTSGYQMGAATGMWGATQGGRRLQGTLWVARASAEALAPRRRPRPNIVDRRPPPHQAQCPEAFSQLRALSAARLPIGHHRQAVAGQEASKNAASEQAVECGSPARSGCQPGVREHLYPGCSRHACVFIERWALCPTATTMHDRP